MTTPTQSESIPLSRLSIHSKFELRSLTDLFRPPSAEDLALVARLFRKRYGPRALRDIISRTFGAGSVAELMDPLARLRAGVMLLDSLQRPMAALIPIEEVAAPAGIAPATAHLYCGVGAYDAPSPVGKQGRKNLYRLADAERFWHTHARVRHGRRFSWLDVDSSPV